MKKINRKNVLIIGSCAKEYALAKKLSELDCVENIFVASGNDAMKEFCTCVDIREDEDVKLLEFAMELSKKYLTKRLMIYERLLMIKK